MASPGHHATASLCPAATAVFLPPTASDRFLSPNKFQIPRHKLSNSQPMAVSSRHARRVTRLFWSSEAPLTTCGRHRDVSRAWGEPCRLAGLLQRRGEPWSGGVPGGGLRPFPTLRTPQRLRVYPRHFDHPGKRPGLCILVLTRAGMEYVQVPAAARDPSWPTRPGRAHD